MARLVSLAVLIAAIAALGVMFFKVIAPFLLPLFLAAVAGVLLTPSFQDIRRRLKGRTRLASAVTTSLVMLLVLLPISAGIIVAGTQAYSFTTKIGKDEVRRYRQKTINWAAEKLASYEDWLVSGVRPPETDEINALIEQDEVKIADLESLRENAALSLDDQAEAVRRIKRYRNEIIRLERLRDAGNDSEQRYQSHVEYFRSLLDEKRLQTRQLIDGQLFGVASKTVGGTLGIVGQTVGVVLGGIITLFIFAVALYYFLADGPTLIAGAEKLIPVQVDYQRELLNEFAKVVRSVVLATFLAATAQGVATTLALWFCGFDHLILLLIVSIVASLIPLAGTWLVWVPCAAILVAEGHYLSAALLSVWGGAVVGTMDNVIRAFVLNNDTKLHPLLALLAVLGGLQVLGIWGVFIGPIVASCLHALVKIFNHELLELSQEKFGSLAAETLSEATEPVPQNDTPSEAASSEKSDTSADRQEQSENPEQPTESKTETPTTEKANVTTEKES